DPIRGPLSANANAAMALQPAHGSSPWAGPVGWIHCAPPTGPARRPEPRATLRQRRSCNGSPAGPRVEPVGSGGGDGYIVPHPPALPADPIRGPLSANANAAMALQPAHGSSLWAAAVGWIHRAPPTG